MSKERLEEIDDLVDILYLDKIEIREFVRKSLDKDNTINSMAHIIKVKNKEMRELSDFLKERNIPLKELSPLVTIMSYVRELEKDYEYLSHHFGLETEQNKRYREALEFYADEENYELDINYNPAQAIDCMILDDNGHEARQALKGESE